MISKKTKDKLIVILDLLPVIFTERETSILKLRYGIKDGKKHTLDYVGKNFNLSRERIRQIEEKCISRMLEYEKTKIVGNKKK